MGLYGELVLNLQIKLGRPSNAELRKSVQKSTSRPFFTRKFGYCFDTSPPLHLSSGSQALDAGCKDPWRRSP